MGAATIERAPGRHTQARPGRDLSTGGRAGEAKHRIAGAPVECAAAGRMRAGRRRPRAGRLLAVALVLATAPTCAGATELDEHAQYAADVEQAKGHLLSSREVYRLGERVRAGVHASHPIQELGYRLWRPVTTVDPALGVQVQAGLKEPGRAVEARVPSGEYDRIVGRALTLLDQGVTRAVPDQVRGDPRFEARVIRVLLVAIDEEYGEAVAQGRIVLEIEYQDAWGFFQRLRALWSMLRGRLATSAPGTVTTVEQQMAVLTRAFPGIKTPGKPVPVEQVARALDAMARALAPVAVPSAGAR